MYFLLNLDNQYIINPLSLHAILNFSFFFHYISFWKKFGSFRFVSFRSVSFRFVSFGFVSFRSVSFLFRFALYRYPFNTIAFRRLDYQLWQCVFVLGQKKKAIDIKPTDETRYCLSWVHKRNISVHFTFFVSYMFTALF